MFFERNMMMPRSSMKKITIALVAIGFFTRIVQASDDAYVKSLEKALVEKITHDGGRVGTSANPVRPNSNDFAKTDANMVGAGVVAEIAKMKESMLDWLSTSELTSKQEAARRQQIAQVAANNCFATCSAMLRGAGDLVSAPVVRPTNVPGMMPGAKPAGMPGGMPGMMPAPKPAAPAMPGAPIGMQSVKPQAPGIVPAPVAAAADEEEDEEEEETPKVPAMAGGTPGTLAPRPMIPVKPVSALPAQPIVPVKQPASPMTSVPTKPITAVRPMVPAQPMGMVAPGMPLAVK